MRRIKVEIDMIKRQNMHQTTIAESDVWQNCAQYSTDIANGTLNCVYANNFEYHCKKCGGTAMERSCGIG